MASLPQNYSPDRAHPLLVHLGGGVGSAANRDDLAYVRRLAGDEDFIAVTMPLFKRRVDSSEPYQGVLIAAFDDYAVLSRCYRVMLGALLERVPNVDPARSAFGGFSNGAHATALLVSGVDRFLLKHFRNFYLQEGGITITSHHKTAVRACRFAYFMGASRRRKARRFWLDRLDAAYADTRRFPNVEIHRMPGVEHAFPDEQIPLLQDWLRRG